MQWFTDRGIATFALDFRGQGRSGGKHGYVAKWDEYLADLASFLAIDELSSPGSPLFILGHSHGGLITAAAAIRGQLDRCRGVILSSPYFELKMPVPIGKRFVARIASVVFPWWPMRSGMRDSMLTRDPDMLTQTQNDPLCKHVATPRWFFEARKAQLATRALARRFNLPMLMLVAGDDTVADPLASLHFFEQASSADKTILHYPDYRHELLRELGRERVFEDILNWVQARIE